jgi:hypothetical protein
MNALLTSKSTSELERAILIICFDYSKTQGALNWLALGYTAIIRWMDSGLQSPNPVPLHTDTIIHSLNLILKKTKRDIST